MAVARWLARLPVDGVFLLLGMVSGGWVVIVVATATSARGIAALLPLVVLAVRVVLPAERLRLRLAGLRLPPPPPVPGRGRLLRLLIGDLDGRRAGYLLLLGPVGVLSAAVCVGAWVLGVVGVVDGSWGRLLTLLSLPTGPAPGVATRVLSAVVLLPVAAALTRLLVEMQVRIAADRLDDAGHRRIEEVLRSRALAVDAQNAELRRIERDLHDGAQARLVALTMQLGLIGRALRPLGTDAEPARTRLAAAAQTANAALADLRHLVRGIHPPILTDRGLHAALSALAADCTVPVDLDVLVEPRPAPGIEAAAYFSVAEALANAAKHADARRCQVRIAVAAGLMHVTVSDDGRGGADAGGAGLTGLRHRVQALDGTLEVTSPVGGPTTIEVELPCG